MNYAYKDFALFYDKLMKEDFDYPFWYKYIENIYEREKIRVDNILELGAGTGNFTLELAKKGYKVDALDISEEMLTLAEIKLRQYSNIKMYKGDMRDFNFNKEYDSVVSICDGLNYILEDKEFKQVLKNVYEHLRPGGIFIFDLSSKYKLKNILGDNNFIDEREGIFYTWENFYDYSNDIVELYLNFFIEKGELYNRVEESHLQRAYDEKYVLENLKDIGFKKVNSYKAFTFNSVEKETERINYIAIK